MSDEFGDIDEEFEDPPARAQRASEARIKEAEAQAVQLGHDSFTAGMPRAACPLKNEHPFYLSNSWCLGWALAWFEKTGGVGVPIYSILGADESDPAALEQRWRAQGHGARREDPGSPLPWQMHTLVGTTWWNIHTFSIVPASKLFISRFGQPELAYGELSARPGVPDYEAHHSTLGIWLGGKYLIEHWVRGDLWPPETQLQWYALRVTRARQELARKVEALKRERGSASYREQQLEYERKNARDAERVLLAFAEANGLPPPIDILNAGTITEAAKSGAATQLQLL